MSTETSESVRSAAQARLRSQLRVLLFFLVAFAAMLLMSLSFKETTEWFPQFTALLGIVLCLVGVAMTVRSIRANNRSAVAGDDPESVEDPEFMEASPSGPVGGGESDQDSSGYRDGYLLLLYFAAFLLVVATVGLLLATAVTIPLWLRFFVKSSWRSAIVSAIGLVAVFWASQELLLVPLPTSIFF
jgi:hypothetical protein